MIIIFLLNMIKMESVQRICCSYNDDDDDVNQDGATERMGGGPRLCHRPRPLFLRPPCHQVKSQFFPLSDATRGLRTPK